MIEILLIIGGILFAPYVLYWWLFGCTLVKLLIKKEWTKPKGLLSAYERLTPEDRMRLDLQRTKAEQETEKHVSTSAWMGSPTPREEMVQKVEQPLKEGIVDHPQGGEWQTPAEAEPPKQSSQVGQPARVA